MPRREGEEEEVKRTSAPAVPRRGALALALLAPACAGAGMSGGGAKSGQGHDLLGAVAPPFSLSDVESGQRLGPDSFQGKVVIVDFWATWCAPCRESFPVYQRLVDAHQGQLVVLGVSVDEEPSGIAKFKNETRVSFPLLWDEGQVVSNNYRPGTMPTSFILDRNGVVRFIHEGFRSGDDVAIEREVSSLLGS
jgi:thiol-disulfide isomerase/thioredoxin